MTDTRSDISVQRIEAILANTAAPANFESAMQMLVELKDYFARLSAVRAGGDPPSNDAAHYHELNV